MRDWMNTTNLLSTSPQQRQAQIAQEPAVVQRQSEAPILLSTDIQWKTRRAGVVLSTLGGHRVSEFKSEGAEAQHFGNSTLQAFCVRVVLSCAILRSTIQAMHLLLSNRCFRSLASYFQTSLVALDIGRRSRMEAVAETSECIGQLGDSTRSDPFASSYSLRCQTPALSPYNIRQSSYLIMFAVSGKPMSFLRLDGQICIGSFYNGCHITNHPPPMPQISL